jgi:hypothetical protein
VDIVYQFRVTVTSILKGSGLRVKNRSVRGTEGAGVYNANVVVGVPCNLKIIYRRKLFTEEEEKENIIKRDDPKLIYDIVA